MQYHKLMFLAVLFVLWGQAVADEVHYKGDLNGDGKVSLYDMVQLASAINHNDSYNYHNDLINDSIVDSKDLKELARLILTETLLPETGLSGGIDGWEEGNDYEGELSAARKSNDITPFLQYQSTSISASDLTFDESVGKYYFDVSLNLSNLFSAALFDLTIKGLSLDKNQNDCPNIVVGGGSSLLSESHLIYGDPIIKNDGKTVRFIVFDEQLHSFGSLSGTIVRIYFDQIQSDEMQVEFHQTELIGYSDSDRSISADYVNECSQPVSKKKYLLVYKVDGDVYEKFSLAYGDSITVLEAPTKEGYTFSGWSDIPETMPAHDVEVTGNFTVNKYLLTYTVDGEVYHTDSVSYGSAINLIDEPVQEGKTFSGWKGAPSTMPSHDVVITGSFDNNVYTLTYKVDGETYKSVQYTYGVAITPEAAPTKEGYTFSGWSEIPETMPAHDVEVTGNFKVNKYLLTYTVDGEVYHTDSVSYGSAINLIDEPVQEGKTFSGWKGAPSTMPSHDVVITGSFNNNVYTLTYKVDGETYKSVQYTYGAAITPEAAPIKEGYTFSGWSEIPEMMPAHDVEVTGNFTVNKYLLTYTVDGEVYHTDSVSYGSAINLIDEPVQEGKTFSGWKGAPSTMPSHDVVITGSFNNNVYTLTYKVDGEIYKSVQYTYGAAITPEAAPTKEGYTFSGWSEIPETMPAHDVIVTGTFKFNPAAAVNPVVEDNSEITEQNAENITEFKMTLTSGATFAVNDGAKVELWIGGVLKGTAAKKDISKKDGVVTVKFTTVSANAGARGMLGEFWNTVATSSSEDVEILVKVAANSFKINNEDITEELSYSYTAKASVVEKIENDVTTLDEINAGGTKDIIYNLNGSRINGNAQKGIIIKNGKKVLVK